MPAEGDDVFLFGRRERWTVEDAIGEREAADVIAAFDQQGAAFDELADGVGMVVVDEDHLEKERPATAPGDRDGGEESETEDKTTGTH